MSETVPLEPDRDWDLPSGPHVGRGCALRVPVSRGPASFELDRGAESPEELGRAEPATEPLRDMELGDLAAAAWHRALDRPIAPVPR